MSLNRLSGTQQRHGTRLARELLDQLIREDVDVTVVLKSLPSAVEFYKQLGAATLLS
jgi:hypothetical protein